MNTTVETTTNTTWQIDPAHTQVGFVVKHMMFAKVRGAFNEFSGEIVQGENGDLTIRDITKSVTLDVTETGTGVDPWGNMRIGIQAEGAINRKDFGLTWNQALEAGGVLVGEEVTLTIEAQAVAQG